MNIQFDNSYARLPEGFYTRIAPRAVAAPSLLAFNTGLAEDLGLSLDFEGMAPVFAGNELLEGSEPIAQVYAGHQFGGFSPQLGDGRAVLLGEFVTPNGRRRDIQLKGSGPTPYSRSGDGRAGLGPVLREYVMSEAMHALGVPTTRALAAALTGEAIYRQEGAVPGAILTRVASSHIRVGTFQYFAARRDVAALQQLYEYTVARHYPEAGGPAEFLQAVIAAQAELVAHWMSLGFIHGVMNTDNTALSGETIDYGPCAFMDVYHPVTVFSSIDAQGRYAYDNQAHVVVWNMAQLATSLVPLMPDRDAALEEFTAIVHAMPALAEAAWLRRMGAKIGIAGAAEVDRPLIEGLLERMQAGRADFTNTFRALVEGGARDQFLDPAAFDTWEAEWRARIAREAAPEALMRASNPWVIPRNHRIEQMISAAREGDFAPFERLLTVLARPYADQPEAEDLRRPPEPFEVVQQTFCGT